MLIKILPGFRKWYSMENWSVPSLLVTHDQLQLFKTKITLIQYNGKQNTKWSTACINYAMVLLKGPIQTKIQNKSITLAVPAINNVDSYETMTNQSGLFNSSKTSQQELVSSYR